MFAPYEALLSALADEVGMDASSLIAAQEIVIDGQPIHLKLDGEGERAEVWLCCRLGVPAKAHRALTLRTLLQANHLWTGTGGATLGMDDDMVSLSVRRRLDGLHVDGLAVLLAKTADISLAWRDFITQGRSQPGLPEFFDDAFSVRI